MTQVTKESLEISIKAIEEVKQRFGFISMGQEYNLKAYKMLLAVMSSAVIGYTSLRAVEYEIWNCGSTVFTHTPEDGDVPLMVAPDFIEHN